MISIIIDAVKSRWDSIFVAICIILVALISFNLGKISALEKKNIQFNTSANIYDATVNPTLDAVEGSAKPTKTISSSRQGRVVGSVNSDKYHFEWCSGAKRISPSNQIWFNSPRDAELAGYVLASNCR